ncbi:MAG: DUF481 domain-containing protein [Myxococcales bacterium]|nr:DUF481 domain-containing protein [Myxococcales bacterium]
MSRTVTFVLSSLVTAAVAVPAAVAQPTPKFEYGKAEELKDVKKAEWSATAEAGLVFTTGNSRTTTVSAGAKAFRKEKQNKFSAEASGTLARASTLAADDRDGNMILNASEVTRATKNSAEAYQVKLRYDRFLSTYNSLFVAALGGADIVAGKDFAGGGQVGYARLLYKTERHEVTAEIGYDFSYENYVDSAADSLAIHSARGFIGYKGKLSEVTSVDGSLELLTNVNEQSSTVAAFEDVRANAAASLSTKLTKSVSFSFGLLAKFDNVPAPLSLAGFTLDPNNPPEALKLDTTTKASLIINFL